LAAPSRRRHASSLGQPWALAVLFALLAAPAPTLAQDEGSGAPPAAEAEIEREARALLGSYFAIDGPALVALPLRVQAEGEGTYWVAAEVPLRYRALTTRGSLSELGFRMRADGRLGAGMPPPDARSIPLPALIRIERTLQAEGDLGVYGDLSAGLFALSSDMTIAIREVGVDGSPGTVEAYRVSLSERRGCGGHSFYLRIDADSGELTDADIGEDACPPEDPEPEPIEPIEPREVLPGRVRATIVTIGDANAGTTQLVLHECGRERGLEVGAVGRVEGTPYEVTVIAFPRSGVCVAETSASPSDLGSARAVQFRR
jgi:hypothetical protein